MRQTYTYEDLSDDVRKLEPQFEGFEVLENANGLLGTYRGYKFTLTVADIMKYDRYELPKLCISKIVQIKKRLVNERLAEVHSMSR